MKNTYSRKINGVGWIKTSPIPEDAPVISATLPATFSMNMYLFKEKRNLRRRNGGIKRSNKMKVKGRSIMFKNLCSKSIAFSETLK